jgi:hypothetical protein
MPGSGVLARQACMTSSTILPLFSKRKTAGAADSLLHHKNANGGAGALCSDSGPGQQGGGDTAPVSPANDVPRSRGAATPPLETNGVAAPDPTPLDSAGGPQTAQQWVEHMVGEMLAAKDMGDARARAAGVLQRFERFTKLSASRLGVEDAAAAGRPAAELAKENALLRRAVQIQAGRMQVCCSVRRNGWARALSAERCQLRDNWAALCSGWVLHLDGPN